MKFLVKFVNFIKFVFPIKSYDFKKFGYMIIFLVYALGGIGIYLISNLQDEGENLAQKQVLAYGVGIVLILFVAMINYHLWAKFFVVLYMIGVGLLLVCKYSNSLPIYGWAHYDARRWIKIGGDPTAGINNTGFEFQPSEITKVVLIICIAKYFDLCRKHIKKLWVFAVSIVIMGIPTYFIFDQPDLSTTIVVVAVFATMVFVSGVSYKYIIPVIAVAVPTALFLFWYVQQDFQTLLDDYQQNRILAMLHPEQFPDLRYQQDNALAAIRSGGIMGKTLSGVEGIRASAYVPVSESDFIFSAVAEEFGFIGSVVVIVMYVCLILLVLRIARRAVDYLGTMIATGIAALLMFQVFVNIGVVSSLLPNTGIALPFMSSGLSSLLVNLTMIGITLNISLQPKGAKTKPDNNDFGFIKA